MFGRRRATPAPSATGWGVPAPAVDGGPAHANGTAPPMARPVGAPPPHPAAPDQQVGHFMEHLKDRLAVRDAEVRELKDLLHDLARGLYPQMYQQHIDADPDWRQSVTADGWKEFFRQGRASRPPPVAAPPPRAESPAVLDGRIPPEGLPEPTAPRAVRTAAQPGIPDPDSRALREDGGVGDIGEFFPDVAGLAAVPRPEFDAVPALPTPEEAGRLWTVRQLRGDPAALLPRLVDPDDDLGRIEETDWGGLIVPGAAWPGRDRHPWTLARAWWPEQRFTVHMLLIWWALQADPDVWRLPRDADEADCHLWFAQREMRHGALFLQGCGSAAEYGALCTRAMEHAVTLTCILPSEAEARELTRHFTEVLGEKSVNVMSMPPRAGGRTGEEESHGPA